MINTNDDVVLTISYGPTSVAIHNRNLEATEDNPVGYAKVLTSDSYNARERETLFQDLLRTGKGGYELTMNLLLNTSQIEGIYKIQNDYRIDKNTQIEASITDINAVPLFGGLTPTPTPTEVPILLQDNRIEDYFTNTFETYNIVITNISVPNKYFFDYR